MSHMIIIQISVLSWNLNLLHGPLTQLKPNTSIIPVVEFEPTIHNHIMRGIRENKQYLLPTWYLSQLTDTSRMYKKITQQSCIIK